MDQIIIGIDIGGTTIKIGFFNEDGDIVHKWQIPTNKEAQGAHIVNDIWNSVSTKLSEFQMDKKIMGIGVGAPGFVDNKRGFIYEAVNIGWVDIDLAKQFAMHTKVPVFVENDANLAALGENWKGAGNKAENLIAVTLGTGVGGGIIANGSILSGVNGTAGEIGHAVGDPNGYPCNCGRVGCLDTIASGPGLVQQAMDKINANPTSNLATFHSTKGYITAKDIFDLASKDDEICKRIIERTAETLGVALANAATVINPSKILIGGGVSNAGEQLLNIVRNSFEKYSLTRVHQECEIQIAQLGNDAGIIGAAYLILQETNKSMTEGDVTK